MMDPSRRINALKQYMDLYNNTGMGPQNSGSTPGVFNPTIFDRAGDAFDFASKQVPQETPDFFGSASPQYAPPRAPMPMPTVPGLSSSFALTANGGLGGFAPLQQPAANYLRSIFQRA